LTPVVNFINILQAAFALIFFRQKNYKLQSQTVRSEKLCKILKYKKAAQKMLVKLTPGRPTTNWVQTVL